MRFDIVAEYQHYHDHLRPVYDALPPENRGTDYGVDAKPRIRGNNVLMVAGYSDLNRYFNRRCVYFEHGAGQMYTGLVPAARPYWAGGPKQHRNAVAFIVPSEVTADAWRAVYPDKPAFAVGSPRLDPWHAGKRGEVEPATVAVTFHWDAQFTGVPETTSAFGYYFQDMLDIVVGWRKSGWHVIGHNHPRHDAVRQFWLSIEMRDHVEYVSDSATVLDRAAVLVADNTTLQADFLSLGRPVVWLNCPGYRKAVEHGGRFWQWPACGGEQVDTPADLAQLDLAVLPRPTSHPYAHADGLAAVRAASAISSLPLL